MVGRPHTKLSVGSAALMRASSAFHNFLLAAAQVRQAAMAHK